MGCILCVRGMEFGFMFGWGGCRLVVEKCLDFVIIYFLNKEKDKKSFLPLCALHMISLNGSKTNGVKIRDHDCYENE